MFRNAETKGRLIFLDTDERTRYKFTIWFDYTRQLANAIREGDIVAIPNFASSRIEKHWSLIQIISATPTHYALGSSRGDITGYPGYIMEAAGNLPVDWLEQETESLEDTTKIVCEGIPLNMEIIDRPGCTFQNVPIQSEQAIPMLGSEVKLLSIQFTERIVNLNIRSSEDIICVGNLVREPTINIFMKVDEAIKTHIGVFGFTGVGKSNFISTIISALLTRQREPTKLIIFDLNGEYLGLLMDCLINQNINSYVLCLGGRTLPGPVQNYLNGVQGATADGAIDAYLRDLYLPRNLRQYKDNYREHIAALLSQNKIRVLDETISISVSQFFTSINSEVFDEFAKGALKVRLEQLVSSLIEGREDQDLNPTLAQTLLQQIAQNLRVSEVNSSTLISGTDTYHKRVGVIVDRLEKVVRAGNNTTPHQSNITLTTIINELNNPDTSSLILINSHDPNLMRLFSNRLGYWTYENRRRRGLIHPLISFIFDEADEFIPSKPPTQSHQESKQIIETLARRGRKFGLGVVIATQRSAYLDTNIMGQLHTYFISKLPRKYDREAVGEAFSISDDIFRQTFKFQKGDWLYISHEAAGLDATPVPIHASNAELRLTTWLGQ